MHSYQERADNQKCATLEAHLLEIKTQHFSHVHPVSQIHAFIHSFIPHSVLPQVHCLCQSEFSTLCDLVLPLPTYLTSSSSCLRLTPRLPVTPTLTSIFLSITRFRRQFLRKKLPIQLAFLHFPSSLTLHLPHDRSNRSSPSFSSTRYQNYPGISELLSEVSKFQHHKKVMLQI